MTPERYQQIIGLARAARERQPAERPTFLAQACAQDTELRRAVESHLLHAEQAEGFLNSNAMELLARTMAEEQTTSPPTPATETPFDSLESQLAPGALLEGRYLIERELGRGGIGAVFLARDLKLPEGAQVVIKVLLQHLLSGENRDWFEQKFRNEIKALSRINHPGVVSALDAGQLPDGRAYFVMQYIPGTTLRAAMTPHGISAKRSGELLRKIAQALDAAHQRSVIHRDLKPGNIMLQTAGDEEFLRIIDFGIATVLETTTATTTSPTKVVGTIAYMSPEQLQGRPTAASDLFALGVILFEMVTGQQPFDADSETQLIEKQRTGVAEKLSELQPGLPKAARAALLKAMAFEASDRYATAREFSEAFNQALAKPDQPDPFQTELIDIVPGQPTMRRRRWMLPSAVLVALSTQRRRWPLPTAILIALLAAATVGSITWRYLSPVSRETPTDIRPNLSAAAERSLGYSLLARRNPKHYPGNKPFVPSGKTVFETGDEVRLTLSSPQDGYLYIINEGPTLVNRRRAFTLLFPNYKDNHGLAKISANQIVQLPPDRWWDFEQEPGTEKLWLIWSESSQELLGANPKDVKEISDHRQIEAIQQFLAKYPVTESKVAPDEAHHRIKLAGKEAVLVGLIKLAHQ
jgi:serine/threonine protein kinase